MNSAELADFPASGDQDANLHPVITLRRYIHTQQDLDSIVARTEPRKPKFKEVCSKKFKCSKKRCLKLLFQFVPIIPSVRKYRFKEYIVNDALAGLSAAFMHLPQGLGFGILASLKPANGLYTSFFPVVAYLVFGTAPHVSFGTNALIALLIAGVVQAEVADSSALAANSTSLNGTSWTGEDLLQAKVATASAATLLSGLLLLLMGLLRFGFLTTYLSTSFTGGFTTAAAVHIATSQIPKMLGLHVSLVTGAFKIVKTYREIFLNITDTNVADLVIALVAALPLLAVKEINERFKSELKFPIPIDLIVIVVSTIISHFANLQAEFRVNIISSVPTGIPTPFIPPLLSSSRFVVDSLVMAILIFALTISMAKVTAKTHNYSVDANQELVAYGLANTFSSFFHCFASCVAPPRTMVLSSMNAKTTLNGIFTALFMLLVILFMGQLFKSLPVSVIGAMIAVAMKKLLLQVTDLKMYWRVNRYDFAIWLVTCLSSIFIDLDIGIAVGIGTSVLTVIIQNQLTTGYLLGKLSSEDLFVRTGDSESVRESAGVKIFRFESSLYFATAEVFQSRLYQATVNPRMEAKPKRVLSFGAEETHKDKTLSPEVGGNRQDRVAGEGNSFGATITLGDPVNVRYIVLDCLPMSYVDFAGATMLQQVVTEYQAVGVTVFLARCPDSLLHTLEAIGFFEKVSQSHVFCDLVDAVETATKICLGKNQDGMTISFDT